jgi:argininosuccinate lyase
VAAAGLGYPLVAKPVDLNAGTAVRRADDDAHLKRMEEMPSGVEVSVG